MTATELINYIYENDKVEVILEQLDCFGVHDNDKEWRCGLPNDINKTRVRIKKNEYLNITIFQSDSKVIRGNIITLTMHIKEYTFPKANKYLHEILGLKYSFNRNKNNKSEEKVKTPLDIFKRIKKRKTFNVNNIEIKDNSILEEYTPNLHIDWLREGILSFTARKFNIGYDYKKKRIIIPERYWCGDENDYMGIMGRTTIEAYEILDIPKYLAIIPYCKTLNLYGLQENYDCIQQSGYVVVHEAQKSVLKRHSRLDGTGVAIGSHDISDEQVKILIGLNVEIIICLDKGISLEHIRYTCEKFYKVRKISYIYDKYDILKNKEAPADKCNKIYNYLFKNRIVYDENEHYQYIKQLKGA